MPRVSVVMPAYNCAAYLEKAVDSVLQQTLEDIELVIVQEAGSRDRTDAILSDLDDPRVRVVRNDTPLGLARSLNRGFALARGEYVARMDADDVALPERLERQAVYLDAHPSVAVVGSAVRYIDADGRELGTRQYPTTPARVLWGMHFDNAMCHPATMLRRAAFESAGGYSTRARDWEDYELWTRLMRYHDLSNLPEVLLEYRIHQGSVSSQRNEEAREHIVDGAQRAMEVTMARPVDRGFVKSLVFPYTIADRRNAIGAAWLLNYVYRTYRSWYKQRSREDTIAVKEDVATRMSHILARSVKVAPAGVPMIVWHTSRGGPGVTVRLASSSVQRGIERLGSPTTGGKRRASGKAEAVQT